MFTSFPYDIQQKILQFKEPKEIIALYESSEVLLKEIIKHTNFTVDCKVILSNEEIEWFKSKNIKVKLFEYKIDENGIEYWYKNGQLHRDNDLPAVISSKGSYESWYKNGNLHRDNDLPAVMSLKSAYRCWYKNGKLHREKDLPAVIISNGSKYWYKSGVFIKKLVV
jgi:antitoxin component YwqK of YwqJK toxin-antitoxin module